MSTEASSRDMNLTKVLSLYLRFISLSCSSSIYPTLPPKSLSASILPSLHHFIHPSLHASLYLYQIVRPSLPSPPSLALSVPCTILRSLHVNVHLSLRVSLPTCLPS